MICYSCKTKGYFGSDGIKVEHHMDHLTWKLPTVWAYSNPYGGVVVRPFCFTNLFFLEVKP